jgi:hypothetical protein
MASNDSRLQGRWEVRGKVTSDDGSTCWRPVHLLWPDDENGDDGEVDYAEGDGSLVKTEFFLHHDGTQESSDVDVDQSQWHNYAVEINGSHVAGYVDGKMFFEDTNPEDAPPTPVHPTLQLDAQDGDGVCDSNTTWQVDWMRIYKP